jgi:ubiquinone/menaquinone biosynthesis C-methylase UbiE
MTSWFHLARVPEPEVMDESIEVEAYASAAAEEHLQAIDQTLVEHVARLFPGEPSGDVLDIGCGPGQIPILLARRWPRLRITGVDAALHMIEQARQAAAAAGVKINFAALRLERVAKLPFPDASFDLVLCNSVLHHLQNPAAALDEIARVARPRGAVLIRDLRRPPALFAPWHIRWHGRHYRGQMRKLYRASVRAAYTAPELEEMLQTSRLNDGRARIFRHGLTHIGIEREAI